MLVGVERFDNENLAELNKNIELYPGISRMKLLTLPGKYMLPRSQINKIKQHTY